jgi:hypothetical protein
MSGQLSPETDESIQAALIRFTANYSQPVDEAQFEVLLSNWRGAAVHEAHWLTADLIDQATEWTLYADYDRDRMPPVAAFLAACKRIKREADAQADSAAILGLPAAKDPFGKGPAAFRNLVKRHMARGGWLAEQHARLVSFAVSSGLEQGTDAMAAYLRPEYQRLCHDTRWAGWPAAEPGNEQASTWVGPEYDPPQVSPVLLALPRRSDAGRARVDWDVPQTTAAEEWEALQKWPHLKKVIGAGVWPVKEGTV